MRRLGTLVGIVLLNACGSSSAPLTPAQLVGSYSVSTVNGQRIPTQIAGPQSDLNCGPGGTSTSRLDVGQLRLSADGTLQFHFAFTVDCTFATGGRTTRQQVDDSGGTYTINGSFVELHRSNGQMLEAAENGTSLQMVLQLPTALSPSAVVFQKDS